ncbi:PAS domain-containing protein [Streptomyces sp. A5-4]|uniref:hybrid sensor histidine kinase/response regulator n=1 Tax=Streptomyces sp. A5-4 TaxID=3384771 RepID=UPI003DA82049
MSSRPSRGAARLAAILDALPDGLLLVNCNGTVVNANTIALETFESPGTGLVGRGLLDLLPGFDSKLIPGSMRRADGADEQGRTKPTRMMARRTDGTELPVEVTSANLADGGDAFRDAHYDRQSFTGDELLMLVVRDLSGAMDTEAELARSQRQTEMILRAASEGVVGTDTDGRVVLVNPAAAQILGYRASDLGGRELHPLAVHSRADGTPFTYEESPLADTLKSGRKHRVRGQVLWAKNGKAVPVDLTTAPVRDGDQLVGAVMTFTDRRPYDELIEEHAEALARETRLHDELVEKHTEALARETQIRDELIEKHAEALAQETSRYEEMAGRQAQLTAVLGDSLRGPLEELRGELGALAADPAGQLWPEANQILHHLAAGYARMTTLVDNVLGFQRLMAGTARLDKQKVLLDAVVAAGVEGAIELIGPGRAQFAVHAPPIEAEVDAVRLAKALAHLVADVAGVDSTGKAPAAPAGGGYLDSTIVVAAAQRGDVVRIEVRGPYAGGDPVHEPIVRGIVQAHGGVLQTHEVPGMGGSAYVLEVPLGDGAGTVAVAVPQPTGRDDAPVSAHLPGQQTGTDGAGRRARRASTDAFLGNEQHESGASDTSGESSRNGRSGESPAAGADGEQVPPTGRRRARRDAPEESADGQQQRIPAQNSGEGSGPGSGGTGRRRGRPSQVEEPTGAAGGVGSDVELRAIAPAGRVPAPSEGSVVTAAEGAHGTGRAALGETVPPQGVPTDAPSPTGRRARRGAEGAYDGPHALPALPAAPSAGSNAPQQQAPQQHTPQQQQAAGRRARRALAPAQERSGEGQSQAQGGARIAFALPPAEADRVPPTAGAADASLPGRHDAARSDHGADHTPPQPHPVTNPTGRRRARQDGQQQPAQSPQLPDDAAPQNAQPAQPAQATPAAPAAHVTPDPREAPDAPDAPIHDAAVAAPQSWAAAGGTAPVGATTTAVGSTQTWPASAGADAHGDDEEDGDDEGDNGGNPNPLAPATTPTPAPGHPQSRAAQPLPPAQPLPAEASTPAPEPADSTQGRAFSVRTLGQGMPFAQQIAQQQNQTLGSGRRRKLSERQQAEPSPSAESPAPDDEPTAPRPQPQGPPHQRLPAQAEGRAYAIGAPDEGSEGPEPLDGPNGAVEVANRPQPRPVDDELPPEPLDNPRRLLVWPAPDVSTQQALSDRGYRPVIVHSREEVDAQIAAFPAALFVDPLTGPITRTALQSLRRAAVAAEVPVLVTAGLGQATREAAYGADPAVLLKALAPRDSEQHPPRVLLIEEHEEIALALTATLERRGMQVARAATDTEAVTLATQLRPNLVVMDLMQVRRRRAGIVDWLRANGQLNRTPLVVYTSAGLSENELPRLASGETVLFLAERSTSSDVQGRIVDLLAKIGTN